ncbi:hypothetical protein TI39_contig851g00014 [Zymoseptoria brevis]|uniref:Amino acid transporter transmembrane domain-containing protein n=1 Tax=Zymoseptoria brevis TaxID=1047168 RepID=A0A0F4GIH1_9PEZI|nr:hypothetical protein TI39_contig851g00014 [Zymoseptoria brevis]
MPAKEPQPVSFIMPTTGEAVSSSDTSPASDIQHQSMKNFPSSSTLRSGSSLGRTPSSTSEVRPTDSLENPASKGRRWNWFGLRRHDTTASGVPLTGDPTSQQVPTGNPPPQEVLTDKPPPGEVGISWRTTSFLLTAETVSLGILGLAYAVSTMGVIPALILMGFIAPTTYFSGIVLWKIKTRHPSVCSYGDAMRLVAGLPGWVTADVMVVSLLLFIMSGHVSIFSSMGDRIASSIGNTWQCTAIFMLMLAVGSAVINMFPKFKSNRYWAIASCISITLAAFTAMGGVIYQANAETSPSMRVVVPFAETTLGKIFEGVSMIIVSYTGPMAYLPIMHEMENLEEFPKALLCSQIFVTTMYTLMGVVIYCYAGSSVPSLALNAASPLIATISYGLAAITIVVAGVITGLVATQTIYRAVRPSKTKLPEVWWSKELLLFQGIAILIWIAAYILANVLPAFGSILSLIGAAVGSFISIGMPASFWLHLQATREELSLPLNEKSSLCSWSARRKDGFRRYKAAFWLKPFTSSFCYILIFLSFSLTGLCLYGSAMGIKNADLKSMMFTCRSNL